MENGLLGRVVAQPTGLLRFATAVLGRGRKGAPFGAAAEVLLELG